MDFILPCHFNRRQGRDETALMKTSGCPLADDPIFDQLVGSGKENNKLTFFLPEAGLFAKMSACNLTSLLYFPRFLSPI